MESVTELMFSTYFPFKQIIKTVPSSERSEVSLLNDINTTQSGFHLPGTHDTWNPAGAFLSCSVECTIEEDQREPEVGEQYDE